LFFLQAPANISLYATDIELSLQNVLQKEAPGYYDVIKLPVALDTIEVLVTH